MKILHVIPYYAPAFAYGGPPRAVYEIAQQQVKSGHSVFVLTTTAFEKDKVLSMGTFLEQGVTITRLSNLSNYVMWKFHFAQPIGVFSYLKENQFDVIHLHEVRTLLNFLLLWKVKDTQVVISPWGTAPYSNSLVLLKRILDWLTISRFKMIEIGFAQTDHELKMIEKFALAKRSKKIPLAVNIQEFSQLPSKKLSRQFFNLKDKEYVYLFLGRFSPLKGLDLIVRAFKAISNKIHNARLLLVGRDDNYYSNLKTLVRELKLDNIVIIHPPLYGKDRFKAYVASDCFVFAPSIFEETGTVCLEALASGLPVITNRQAEIPYLKEADGVFYSDRTEKALASTMLRVRNTSPKVNKERLRNYFDWEKVATKMTEQYES